MSGLTEQMKQDMASVTNLGYDNVPSPGSESRGSAAGIGEDAMPLVNATVKTSNTQRIDITEDAEAVTARLSRKTGYTVPNL